MPKWEEAVIVDQPVIAQENWRNAPVVGKSEFTPEEAGNNAVKGLAVASKTDTLDPYEKQVQHFYNWLKTAPTNDKVKAPYTRFANPMGLRRWLSRKFGTGEDAAWFDALDMYANDLSWDNPEKWTHFGVGAVKTSLEFAATAGAGELAVAGGLAKAGLTARAAQLAAKAGTAGKLVKAGTTFAAYEGLQAPREGETLGQRAISVGKSAAFGAVLGVAGKYIPKARYRIPATVSGSMLVTAVGGGSAKQIVDSGAEMLGWEVIGLAHRGASKFEIAASARKHNPDLAKIPAEEIERSAKQIVDIDKAIKDAAIAAKTPPTKATEGKTPAGATQITSPIVPSPEVKPVVDLTETNKMLLEHLDTARKLRADEVEPAIKELHARQAEKATGELQKGLAEGLSVGQAIRKSKKGYIDRAIVPEIEPPPLTENQWNRYSDRILEVYPSESTKGQFLRSNAQDAFDRLRDGKIITNYELQILEPILGRDTTIAIYDKLKKYRSPAERKWEIARNIITFWKLPFATDVQFIRQASSLAARHPVEYAKGSAVALKAYIYKGFAEQAIKEVKENPNHEDAKKAGMNFIPDTPYAGDKPEQFVSRLPESMAILGEKNNIIAKIAAFPIRGYGKWLMASERSFVASTNHFMQNLWDSQAKIWSQSLSEFEKTNPDKKSLNKFRADLDTEKGNYANTINTFMKLMKAKSPTGKAVMKVANLILFSPSMTFSRPYRLKVLAMNKGSRLYAAQIVGTEIGKIQLISAIGVAIGAMYKAINPDEEPPIDSDLNPLSSNWGKIKVGNTYYDFGGGDIQFYRTLARLVALHTKNQAGEIRPIEFWDTVKNYGQQRETAFIGTMAELISGKDYMGKPITAIDALTQSQIPQFAENIYQATKTDGIVQGLLAGMAGLSSAGVSSYPPAGKTEETLLKNKLAQTAYKMNWIDLSPMAQQRLTRANRPIIQAAEQKTNKERIERQDDEYLVRIRKAEREGGQGVLKLISPESRQVIKNLGIELGLARTSGDWSMNDKRFEQYQKLTAEYLDAKLSILITRPIWDRITDQQKEGRISNEIAMAKARARNAIIREANKETR